jgi:hypothetical protein
MGVAIYLLAGFILASAFVRWGWVGNESPSGFFVFMMIAWPALLFVLAITALDEYVFKRWIDFLRKK